MLRLLASTGGAVARSTSSSTPCRGLATSSVLDVRMFAAKTKYRPEVKEVKKEVAREEQQIRAPSRGYREERVVVTDGGAVIACWHPQPKFPYELSRPIPRHDQPGTSAVLKTQVTEDMKELFHHKEERFHRRDLMRVTWSTKHKWFHHPHQIARDKKERQQLRKPREKPFL